MNFCRFSVCAHDEEQLAYTASLGINFESYSPLRHVDFDAPAIAKIAAAHSKSKAEVRPQQVKGRGAPTASQRQRCTHSKSKAEVRPQQVKGR
eukprot:879784-Pyramimonas_sp.AAC.1